jgi:hypothetical protein
MSSSVNSGRPDRSFADRLTDTGNLVKLPDAPLVKPENPVEASVAKARRNDTLTKKDGNNIRQLHNDGYTLPRIRQMLALKLTLTHLRSIVNEQR